MTTPPGLLICAGLDPSGGAGLIADVRIAAMLDTRPVGIVTATTIQNTTGVVASVPLDPQMIREQLELLLSDVEVYAVKIGMVGSSAIARAISEALALTRAAVVWDPVAYASRGDTALVEGTLDLSLDALAQHLTVITPNARELALLACADVRTIDEAIAAGQMLCERIRTSVLVKGGHLGGDDSIDYLCRPTGVIAIPGARIPGGEDVHGTGCALATAIAAHLALGSELVEACTEAKRFVAELIAAPVSPGRGAPAVV
jgi:hydroxymethylpyrimidine/phosphomethylpyrimidine kinase